MFYRGRRVEFLPPYSPDYNPIELAFSAIKAHIRRYRDMFNTIVADFEESGDDSDLLFFLHESVWTVTPQDALGWFSKCDYI